MILLYLRTNIFLYGCAVIELNFLPQKISSSTYDGHHIFHDRLQNSIAKNLNFKQNQKLHIKAKAEGDI